MRLKDKIPEGFYKLFASKYRDAYMLFLLSIYEETTRLFSALSLTETEARQVIGECMEREGLTAAEDEEMEEGESFIYSPGPARFLSNLTQWGWLKRDFDERSNDYFYSFPSYANAYMEVFKKLWSEEEDLSHESIRRVYSSLHTYLTDNDRDVEILSDALRASRRLLQLLSNMQDGMRSYFDQLSGQREVRGIQEVLVEEINNSDSRKYAMLTSTDSFYRYKEAVKELVQDILEEHERFRTRMGERLSGLEEGSAEAGRCRRRIQRSLDGDGLVYQIEREFDLIEVKYNRLIEQKSLFASRASARIRYLLREGGEEDCLLSLIGLLREGGRRQELLSAVWESLGLTAQNRIVGDKSFYMKREERRAFEPQEAESQETEERGLGDFVLRPEYTQREIDAFVRKNTRDGVFSVTEETVGDVSDLEKLLFVWRDGAVGEGGMRITWAGGEPVRKQGMKYTKFTMEKDEDRDA